MWLISFIVVLLALALFDYLVNDFLRRIVKQINSNPDFLKSFESREACKASLTASARNGFLDPLAVYYRYKIESALNKYE